MPKFEVDHKDYLKLLRKLRELPNVKKYLSVPVIRFDYLMADKDDTFSENCASTTSAVS